jgi:hypothetical protein
MNGFPKQALHLSRPVPMRATVNRDDDGDGIREVHINSAEADVRTHLKARLLNPT